MAIILYENTPYLELRKLMDAKGVSVTELRTHTTSSISQFSQKMVGKYAFTQDEIYDIVDFLGIDDKDISKYFPRRTAEQRAYRRSRNTKKREG